MQSETGDLAIAPPERGNGRGAIVDRASDADIPVACEGRWCGESIQNSPGRYRRHPRTLVEIEHAVKIGDAVRLSGELGRSAIQVGVSVASATSPVTISVKR